MKVMVKLFFTLGVVSIILFLGVEKSLAASSKKMKMVPKWGKFEQTFKSAFSYTNPLADVSLTVVFTSPVGEKITADGFWDGGRNWTIRFSPDLPGLWKFKTECSDRSNRDLDAISGEFLCIASLGHSVFDHHGPVMLARDRKHLEFEDHTPFFWLADTVWNGASAATADEWNFYAQTRARQKFSAAQWIAITDTRLEKGSPFLSVQPLKINMDYFRKLDARANTLNQAGILNVIVPLAELDQPATNSCKDLPDAQAIMLLRYMAARWNANQVVWLLTCGGNGADRWKQIAREVFGKIPHAPVMLFTGEDYWATEEFRQEPWLDLVGYRSGQELSEESQEWLLAGPVSADWKKEPAHPFINIEPPYENEPGPRARVNPLAVRRSIYWSLLNTPTAGVTYGGQGVWDWQVKGGEKPGALAYEYWPTWQKALFMPAAKQMETVADIFGSIDFARLRPAPELIAHQPGSTSPYQHIAAASTLARDLAVIYIPEGGTVELNSKFLPPAPDAVWINPQTGARTPAPINRSGKVTKLVNSEPGDSVLLIESAGK